MEILVLCGIYLVELFCYQMGLKLLFGTKVKQNKKILVGIVFPITLGALSIYETGKLVLVTLFVILLNVVLTKGKLIEKIFENIIVLAFSSCLENIFAYILKWLLGEVLFVSKSIEYFGFRCCTAAAIGIIYFFIRKEKGSFKMPAKIFPYFVVGLAAASVMFCMAVINYIKDFVDNPKFSLLCNILDVIVHLSVFLLVIFIVNIRTTNKEVIQLLKNEKQLKYMQANYYRQLLKTEEVTRKYRHDMNNHFYYIQVLLENDQMLEAKEYFKKLQGNFQTMQKSNYVTGNEMVDVIMNYFLGALSAETEVSIIGRCPVKLKVEDVDICVIFSNVFQNVMEAISANVNETGKVEVHVKKGKSYVEYIVANSFEGECAKRQGMDMPPTRKADEKNHGIGLENIKKAVERNGGKFSWESKNGMFYTKIILPI